MNDVIVSSSEEFDEFKANLISGIDPIGSWSKRLERLRPISYPATISFAEKEPVAIGDGVACFPCYFDRLESLCNEAVTTPEIKEEK